jgi:hypothetical protein
LLSTADASALESKRGFGNERDRRGAALLSVAASSGETSSAITECATDAGYRALVLCDRPAAYFRFGEDGGPTAYDEIDGGPLGSYESRDGVGVVEWVAGAIADDPSTAAHFDGMSRATVGRAFPFAGNASYTFEAWVRPDTVDFSYRRIVERATFDTAALLEGYVIVNHASDGLIAERVHTGTSIAASGPALSTTGYSHVVMTFDGTMLLLYVNDARAGAVEAPAPIDAVNAVLLIGDSQGGGGGFIGAIDEVAIYDYALSPAQIASHYRVGRDK